MPTARSPQRFAQFGAVMMAALGLIPGGGLALGMPPRLLYDAELYMEVTSTMYTFYTAVAAIIQLFAITMAVLLTALVRKTPAFRVALVGTACLGLSVLVWFFVVGPVNAEWMQARAEPGTAAQAFLALRPRWEYGHLVSFVIWFAGFCFLLYSLFLYRPRPPEQPSG